MIINKEQATELARNHVKRMEEQMNSFGSALPGYEDRPKHNIVLLEDQTQTHDFGWVFFYDTDNENDPLAGNAPLIVSNDDGKVYVTGTAFPLKFFIDEFRKGNRIPAE